MTWNITVTDPDKLTSSSYHFQVVAALTARVLDQVFGMISLEFKNMIKKLLKIITTTTFKSPSEINFFPRRCDGDI